MTHALRPPFLLTVRLCNVCEREREREEIEGLVPIILQTRPVRWVSLKPCILPASSVIPTLNAGSH